MGILFHFFFQVYWYLTYPLADPAISFNFRIYCVRKCFNSFNAVFSKALVPIAWLNSSTKAAHHVTNIQYDDFNKSERSCTGPTELIVYLCRSDCRENIQSWSLLFYSVGQSFREHLHNHHRLQTPRFTKNN